MAGASGWLSRLSVQLRLRSWSHGSWVCALGWALCWQLRAWSLLRILCLPLSLKSKHEKKSYKKKKEDNDLPSFVHSLVRLTNILLSAHFGMGSGKAEDGEKFRVLSSLQPCWWAVVGAYEGFSSSQRPRVPLNGRGRVLIYSSLCTIFYPLSVPPSSPRRQNWQSFQVAGAAYTTEMWVSVIQPGKCTKFWGRGPGENGVEDQRGMHEAERLRALVSCV